MALLLRSRTLVLKRAASFAVLVAALSTPGLACGTDLDRLFYTPQQRAELDKRRATNAPAPDAEQPKEALVTVNGYVARSNGKTTTWINGVPRYDSIRSSDPARVSLEAADGRANVKIGQTLDNNSGQVLDNFADGQIRINRKSTNP